MKILQVSSARALGGGERHLADLARGLARRGHEIYAALPAASPLRAELSSLPPQNRLMLPLRNALDLMSARKMALFASENKVDIIHAHLARDYPPAALAARLSPNTRLVITRHVLFPLSRAHRLALSNVARVIAVSGAVARALVERNVFSMDKIRVVPNAIDFQKLDASLRDFEREDYRRRLGTKASFLVGTLGELSAVKGQADFIRAAAIVAQRKGGAVEFLIAGEDNSRAGGNCATLERLIAELNLADRVRLLGRTDEAPAFLSSLDVFVSSSRSEAFGLAIVEALGCGCPVVATATEGAKEIIEDRFTGMLVPIENPAEMAAAILSLLDDAERGEELATKGRETARARFDVEGMVEATERVYEEALAE